MSDVLVYVAGAALVVWGASHVAPTRAVADSFGPLSDDNRRILVMEWVAEGIAHIGLGALVVAVAIAGGDTAVVYRTVAALLVALAGPHRAHGLAHAGDLVQGLPVRAGVGGGAAGRG